MRALPVEIQWDPGLSIYASEPFLKAVGDEFGWLGGADDAGTLRCILPYTIVRKATVRMVRFRVETIPLAKELDINEEISFLNSVVAHFRSIGADIIIPGTTNAIFRAYPEGAIAVPYGTLKIDLTQPEERLWENVHPKHRNVIRNATKKGVTISHGPEYADQAYELVRATFQRSRLPFMGRGSFMRMLKGLGEYARVFIATYQGVVQGCAVVAFSNHSAYYVYGGSIPCPLTGATNLLQWEAIRSFRAIGVRFYDFCGVRINPDRGSKQAGLMMFKERFGPELVSGFMWKIRLRPIRSTVYSLAVRMLRGGDIVDVECKRLSKNHGLSEGEEKSPITEEGREE